VAKNEKRRLLEKCTRLQASVREGKFRCFNGVEITRVAYVNNPALKGLKLCKSYVDPTT
jgi:hypothetical protein